MESPTITAKCKPGNYFIRTVSEEMQIPGLLDHLKESGVIFETWQEDDGPFGGGDYYPTCKPRHRALMLRAYDEYETRRNSANCRACRALWGAQADPYCETCFCNKNRRNVTND